MNGRRLSGRLAKLGLSWPARARLVQAAKIACAPAKWLDRRKSVRDIGEPARSGVATLHTQGFAPLDMVPPETVSAVLDACRNIHARAVAAAGNERGFNNRNIIEPDDFRQHPELLAFMQHPAVVATISTYIDAVPIIGSVQLWWSTPNEKTEGSQLFHRDKAAFRQAKIFLNIAELTADNGPFTFIAADDTQRLSASLRDPFDRVMDDELANATAAFEIRQLTGPAGHGALVDTCRCLHQGSRTRAGERLALMVHYLPYHCIAEPKDKPWARFAKEYASSQAPKTHWQHLLFETL